MLDHSELLDRTFHWSERKLLFLLHVLFVPPKRRPRSASAPSPTIKSRDWYRFSRAAGFFFTPNGMEIAEMKKPRSYFTTGNYDNSRLAPIKKHNRLIYQNVRCWSNAVLLISERRDHFLTARFQLPGAENANKVSRMLWWWIYMRQGALWSTDPSESWYSSIIKSNLIR